MKLADIKVGTEYGVVDSTGHYSREKIRQCKVLEQVVVEERIYPRWGGASTTRKVKKWSVELLGPATTMDTWRNAFTGKPEGTIVTVESRLLVAPWAELAPAIKAKAEREQRDAATVLAYKERIARVLGYKSTEKLENWVRVRHNGAEYEFEGRELDLILDLAEAGRAVQA